MTNVLLKRVSQMPAPRLFDIADGFAGFGLEPISVLDMDLARQICLRCQYSWWDCLLLASALNLGCTHFLSEDLPDGQSIEGLTIVYPFAHTPDQVFISR